MLVNSISGGGRRILLEVIGFYKKSLRLKQIWPSLTGSSQELTRYGRNIAGFELDLPESS